MARRPLRLCYVLPLYDPDTEQHFYYLLGFLEQLATRAEILVIVEKATAAVQLDGVRHLHVQRCRWGPLRALEMLLVMALGVCLGYRRIYTHYSIYGGAAGVLCRLLGARALYWNCEENAGHFLPFSWHPRVLATKLGVEWPTATVIRLSSTLVTGTATMARYYHRIYGVGPRRTAVMATWVDGGRFHPGPAPTELRRRLELPGGAPVALFVHRLSPRKGSRELLELMLLLRERRPALRWVVCGDGPDRGWLEAEVAARGLSAHVTVLGNVPNRRIGDHYRLADIMVMPSRQEGLPRVLLEAQACGLPAVAFDVGGVRDVMGPVAVRRALAPRGDVQALAACLEQVLGSADLRQALREEGLMNVKGYTLEHTLARFRRILRGRA